MAIILHMDTDHVRSVSQQLSQASEAVRAQLQSLSGNVQGMNWQGPGRDTFVAEFEQTTQAVYTSLESANALSQRLQREADEWEQVAASYSLGDSLSPTWLIPIVASGGGGSLFPLDPVIWISLPAAFLGFVAALDTSKLPAWLLPFLPSLPQSPIVSPVPEEPPALPEGIAPPLTPPEVTASATPVAIPGTYEPNDVPVRDQHGLKYRGGNTAYGCVPTSASMILDYWHRRDPAHPTLSAQELLNKNAEQGEFRGKGMGIDQLGNDIGDHYVVKPQPNSNRTTLEQALGNGPVMAVVHLGIKPIGEPHAVVVTGVASDGTVSINDPWTGKSHTYSWEGFDASWGASFGKDQQGVQYSTRIFTTIVPNAN